MPPILHLLDLLMLTIPVRTGFLNAVSWLRAFVLCSQCLPTPITLGGGNLIGVYQEVLPLLMWWLFGWWRFVYSETITMRLGRESASADKALTRAREEFRRPIWEIDDVVSILIHNLYCQTDVHQLFDDIFAAKSPEGNYGEHNCGGNWTFIMPFCLTTSWSSHCVGLSLSMISNRGISSSTVEKAPTPHPQLRWRVRIFQWWSDWLMARQRCLSCIIFQLGKS